MFIFKDRYEVMGGVHAHAHATLRDADGFLLALLLGSTWGTCGMPGMEPM